MNRALASLLLVAVSYPLIGPALLAGADVESSLPACCRRDGKHHCAMMDMAVQQESEAGPSLRASKCPQFPKASIVSECWKSLAVRAVSQVRALRLRPADCPKPANPVVAVNFSQSLQKRGPPAILKSHNS